MNSEKGRLRKKQIRGGHLLIQGDDYIFRPRPVLLELQGERDGLLEGGLPGMCGV